MRQHYAHLFQFVSTYLRDVESSKLGYIEQSVEHNGYSDELPH